MHGGPVVKALDEALAKCGVERQAYHGRAFVGNHVDKMLEVIEYFNFELFTFYNFAASTCASFVQLEIILAQKSYYSKNVSAFTEKSLMLYFFSYQRDNIRDLCNAVPKTVCDLGIMPLTPIHNEALDINKNFKNLFLKYGICHKVINSAKSISTKGIDSLGNVKSGKMQLMRVKCKKRPNRSANSATNSNQA